MSTKRFITLTIITSFLAIIGIFIMDQFPQIALHRFFSIITFFVFLLSTAIIYMTAKKLVSHRNKFLFNYVVIASIFFKLIFAVIMIVAYQKLGTPENKYFVLPFVVIYLIFTIFETYFLSIMAKTKPTEPRLTDHERNA